MKFNCAFLQRFSKSNWKLFTFQACKRIHIQCTSTTYQFGHFSIQRKGSYDQRRTTVKQTKTKRSNSSETAHMKTQTISTIATLFKRLKNGYKYSKCVSVGGCMRRTFDIENNEIRWNHHYKNKQTLKITTYWTTTQLHWQTDVFPLSIL